MVDFDSRIAEVRELLFDEPFVEGTFNGALLWIASRYGFKNVDLAICERQTDDAIVLVHDTTVLVTDRVRQSFVDDLLSQDFIHAKLLTLPAGQGIGAGHPLRMHNKDGDFARCVEELFGIEFTQSVSRVLFRTSTHIATTGFCRHSGDFRPTDGTTDRELEAIYSELSRAAFAYMQFVNAGLSGLRVTDSMDPSARVLLLVNDRLELVYANPAALRFLRGSKSVALRSAKIRFAGDVQHQHLTQRIADAREISASSSTLLLGRNEDEAGAVVDCHPFPFGRAFVGRSTSRLALLEIRVPARAPRAVTTAFADRHRLTRAETKVLDMLCRGLSSKQIAMDDGKSVFTVRTQIKSILSKVGVNRQSELLVRVLLERDEMDSPSIGKRAARTGTALDGAGSTTRDE